MISIEHVENLLEIGFSIQIISLLLGVSKRTVERHMAENGLRVHHRYSALSDTDRDSVVLDVLTQFPTAGYNRITGYLRARGIRAQRDRVRNSMRRVNPEGVFLRSFHLFTTNRRRYTVKGPQSLWHIDGHQKLIR